MKKYPHKRKGSVCIASLAVLTLITVMCISVHERIKSRYISRNMVVESENILRRAEGVSIVAKAKVIEITQSFYDRFAVICVFFFFFGGGCMFCFCGWKNKP